MLLPSGSLEEYKRAKQISAISHKAKALDLMPLNEIAYVIKNADFCIASDTGLAHLSALSGTPSITLYGPTKTSLIGTNGVNQRHLIGKNEDINKSQFYKTKTKFDEHKNQYENYYKTSNIINFINKVPKAELHLHIEGSLEPELMFKLSKRNKIEIPFKSVEEIRSAYDFTNLDSFLKIYYQGSNVLINEEDFFLMKVLTLRFALILSPES